MDAIPAASQQRTTSLRAELAALARLGGPIALVQFGQTMLNFVDVAFLGHHDAAAMPSMSLGNTLCWAAIVFCMGVLAALDPLLSQAIGARDQAAVTRTLWRGAVLALLLTLPSALLLLPAPTWFEWLGQKPELIAAAATYARINVLGILPFLWFSVLRALLSAHSRTRPQVVVILLGNLLNAALDWILIPGNLGMPALGVAGAAWATVLCRWGMFALLVLFARAELAPHVHALRDRTVRSAAMAAGPLLRLFRLGMPIGGQFALEMGVFAATALLIGRLDAAVGAAEAGGPRLGGHQIAIQLASLSFMLPLGLGMAAAVRIGWASGRGDLPAARRTAAAALLCAIAVMTAFMLLFLTAPHALARILSSDPDILAVAAVLIPIAGVFQIGDGLQVVAIGALRGIGDVRSPFYINAVGFWLLGLPIGHWLAKGLGTGPAGYWWGLVAGLFAVAAALLCSMRLRFSELRARLSVD